MFAGRLQSRADTVDLARTDRADVYVGGDYAVSDDLTLGVLAADVDGDVNAAFGRAQVDGTSANVFARKKLGSATNVVARVGYGSYTNVIARDTTDVNQAVGRTGSDAFTLGLGVNWGRSVKGVTIVPRADMTYTSAEVDGFTEQGANDRLALSAIDSDRLIGHVGASIVGSHDVGGRNLSWELSGGVDRNLTDRKSTQSAAVVLAPGAVFNQTFLEDDRTRASFGARVGYEVTDRATIFASYEDHTRSRDAEVSNAGVRVSF